MADLAPLPSWDSDATWKTFEDGSFHGWVGQVEVQKHPHDLARYLELIEASQPDLVVETGTRAGGSALWFAEQGLRVVTIDVSRSAGKEARQQLGTKAYDQIEWWVGSSIEPLLASEVADIARGARVMVSLDSDHHSSHVQGEIALWAPLVSAGCYLVVEDACFDMWPPSKAAVGGSHIPRVGGPLDAIRRSGLGENPGPIQMARFWRDESLEGLTTISHSPVGWWRAHE